MIYQFVIKQTTNVAQVHTKVSQASSRLLVVTVAQVCHKAAISKAATLRVKVNRVATVNSPLREATSRAATVATVSNL